MDKIEFNVPMITALPTMKRRRDPLTYVDREALSEALREIYADDEEYSRDLDPDEIVLETDGSIEIRFSYPLRTPVYFNFAPEHGDFTRADLIADIVDTYYYLYQNQNRRRELGVHGHGMGDLGLVSMQYDPDEEAWTLSVDS